MFTSYYMTFYITVYGISYCLYYCVVPGALCSIIHITVYIVPYYSLLCFHTSYSIFTPYSIFTLHYIINYIAVVYDISLFGPRGTVPRSRHCINGAPYLLSGRKPVRQSANLFFSTKTSFPIKRLRI